MDLQWTGPSYNGGIRLDHYTVSNRGHVENVTNSSVTVNYSTSRLVYGEVLVSAVNYCGQRSQPTNINIPAAGEITSSLLTVALIAICILFVL